MCGIVALLDCAGAGVDPNELVRIRDTMAARGPDGKGLWISPDARVGLAHRRLSLLDLSEAGAQPMANADCSLRIVFNGEIYNYRALRRELEEKGFVFRSGSDTEVLLHLYACKGEGMLDALRGMFAFVIWDERRQRLFAARDPFGIKPLYIADDGGSIRIASQVKALLAGRIDTSREPAGQVGFLLLGYVPEPFTIYRSIVALPAGSCFTVEADGRRSIRQFYSIGKRLAAFEETAKSAFDANELLVTVRDTIANSVKAHLVADVPVAVFLSAGMDSATIAGLASEQAPETLRSVTLGFEEYRGTINDETVHAQLLAECYNTDHTVRWYSRDEFEGHVQSIVAAMDQPSTDGLNTYFVSKAARSCGVKTALSGLGGDELFGTYPSFRDIPRMTRLLGGKPVASAGRVFRLLSCPLLAQFTSTKYAGLFEYGGTYAGAYLLRRALFMPWELKRILPREILREGWERLAPLERLSETVAGIKSTHLKISALEMSWYMRNQLLRDSDWAGMANSIEIRVPLVDIAVFGALSPLLGRLEMKGKQFLKDVPEKPIPEAVATRRKTGFAVPIHKWNSPRDAGFTRRNLSTGLKDWALRLVKEFDLIG